MINGKFLRVCTLHFHVYALLRVDVWASTSFACQLYWQLHVPWLHWLQQQWIIERIWKRELESWIRWNSTNKNKLSFWKKRRHCITQILVINLAWNSHSRWEILATFHTLSIIIELGHYGGLWWVLENRDAKLQLFLPQQNFFFKLPS